MVCGRPCSALHRGGRDILRSPFFLKKPHFINLSFDLFVLDAVHNHFMERHVDQLAVSVMNACGLIVNSLRRADWMMISTRVLRKKTTDRLTGIMNQTSATPGHETYVIVRRSRGAQFQLTKGSAPLDAYRPTQRGEKGCDKGFFSVFGSIGQGESNLSFDVLIRITWLFKQ